MAEPTLTLSYTTAKEVIRRFLGFKAQRMVRQTFTAATSDVITATAHGFVNGEVVQVASSTTLPAGLTANTNYFVVSFATNTLSVSDVPGGTAVNITDTGTGTHYIFSEDLVTVEQIMNSGASMFYTAHNWEFLFQWTTLTTGTEYTATANATTNVVTCTGHPFVDTDTIRFSTTTTLPAGLSASTTYYVRDAVAATSFKVALTSGGTAVDITDTGTGTHYARAFGYAYNLPDNFARLRGNMRFAASEAYGEIQNTSVERILQAKVWADTSARPYWVAVRQKAVAQTTGQRMEAIFHPTPDDSYTLTYCYRINPENWYETTREYPLGGAWHREALLEAMLSRAETYRDDEIGIHNAEYARLLGIAKERDSELAPDNLGYNGDGSSVTLGPWPVASTQTTTYTNS